MPVRRAFFLFIAVFAFYWLTLAPTFLWSDSAKLAIFAYQKAFVGGGFGVHVGHSLLGYLFSFLPFSFAYTQNLMSATFGSLTIVLLFSLIRMRASDTVAILASIVFAVSHLFWHYSVINETYSLLVFFLALLLYCVLKAKENPGYLYLASFILGFGYSNHGEIALAVPGCAVLLGSKRLRYFFHPRIFVFITLCLIGSCQVLLLPLFFKNPIGAGISLDLFRHLNNYLQGSSKLLHEVFRYPFYLSYQFPTLAFVFGIYGFFVLCKKDRPYAFGTLIMWACIVLFSLQYFYQRQFAFLIPSFFIFALWIAEGLKVWMAWMERSLSKKTAVLLTFCLTCVPPPVIYYSTYKIAEARHLKLANVRELPYRDNLRYFLFPPKQFERGAETYVSDCFQQAERGAVILADFNPGIAIQYGQIVLGERRDITVRFLDPWLFSAGDPVAKISEFLQQQLSQNKAVYLADRWEPYYKTSELSSEFEFKQEGGPLWRVTARVTEPRQ